MLRTIPASEIKRRGISAVDEMLRDGAVHVIKNDRPSYVILSEADFTSLVEAKEEAYVLGIQASLADIAAGRVTRYENVDDLIRELGLEE